MLAITTNIVTHYVFDVPDKRKIPWFVDNNTYTLIGALVDILKTSSISYSGDFPLEVLMMFATNI